MDVLFIHNNFPAQFQHLAPFLAKQPGVRVAAIGARTSRAIEGIRLIRYAMTTYDTSSSHPFARRFDLLCQLVSGCDHLGAQPCRFLFVDPQR